MFYMPYNYIDEIKNIFIHQLSLPCNLQDYTKIITKIKHHIAEQPRTFWWNEEDTSIKLQEHISWYLLRAEMHDWQEVAAAFGPWLSIKSKKNCVFGINVF